MDRKTYPPSSLFLVSSLGLGLDDDPLLLICLVPFLILQPGAANRFAVTPSPPILLRELSVFVLELLQHHGSVVEGGRVGSSFLLLVALRRRFRRPLFLLLFHLGVLDALQFQLTGPGGGVFARRHLFSTKGDIIVEA